MSNNIFKSKKYELGAIIRDALAEGLPPLFRVHRELLKRADPINFELACSVQKLAQSLGYSVGELLTALEDLLILNFIEYQMLGKGNKKCKIKILVR